jgi:AraC family transcriptional regulator of arabinose operon
MARASRRRLPAPRRWLPAPLPRLGGGIEVHALGCGEWMDRGEAERPRGLNCWLIMAFHQAVRVGTRAGPVALPGDSVMVWAPMTAQRYGSLRHLWCHSWIHCSGPAVDRLAAACGVRANAPVGGIPARLVEARIQDIFDEISGPGRPDALVIELTLHLLFRHIARAQGAAAAVPPGLLRARRHLERHFAAPLRLDELARLARLSRNHFCTASRRWFVVPPSGFMLRLRLERDRERPIAGVARAVGYADPASFYRLFQRRLGVAPSAVRAEGLEGAQAARHAGRRIRGRAR